MSLSTSNWQPLPAPSFNRGKQFTAAIGRALSSQCRTRCRMGRSWGAAACFPAVPRWLGGHSLTVAALTVAVLAALMTSACGYRVAGRATSGLPPQVHTIAVPTFQNQTFQFKIEQKLTAAVIHEFLTRTSYRIQSDTEGSDAILQGLVTFISSGPIVFDPNSGRTTKVLVSVGVRVSVLDTKTRQPIYKSTDVTFREPYEVSTDPATYFAEDSPALDRLSRDVASSLVSTIIENF